METAPEMMHCIWNKYKYCNGGYVRNYTYISLYSCIKGLILCYSNIALSIINLNCQRTRNVCQLILKRKVRGAHYEVSR